MEWVGLVLLAVLFAAGWAAYRSVRRDRAYVQMIWDHLRPLGELLEKDPQLAVDPALIQSATQRPAMRHLVRQMLKELGRPELFPAELLTRQSDAESRLAAWLLRPRNHGAEPTVIELEQIARRECDDLVLEVWVFRFKMAPGHWSGSEWQLGVVGPIAPEEAPFEGAFGAFVRASTLPQDAETLVDEYLALMAVSLESEGSVEN